MGASWLEIDTHVLRIVNGIWVGKIVFLIFRICVNTGIYGLQPTYLLSGIYGLQPTYILSGIFGLQPTYLLSGVHHYHLSLINYRERIYFLQNNYNWLVNFGWTMITLLFLLINLLFAGTRDGIYRVKDKTDLHNIQNCLDVVSCFIIYWTTVYFYQGWNLMN